MRKLLFPLISIFILTSQLYGLDFSVVDLRCDYQESPLGIDNARPCFSWKLQTEEKDNLQQASYQMGNLCRANQIQYLHILQPNQYVKGSKVLSEWEKTHAYSGPDNLARKAVEEGYPFLLEYGKGLTQQDVAFYDLTQIFAGRAETLYRDNSCHYNERGYIILSEHIAQALEDHVD